MADDSWQTVKLSMSTQIRVPFVRPNLEEEEFSEVLDTLRSGWLTSGPKVKRFEAEFASAVHAKHAVALNSCTAALHLAVEALKLNAGTGVLVPTMTFAATAEIIRYAGGIPILVDCDPLTHNMDLDDAESKLSQLKAGKLKGLPADMSVVGMIPVHVGGLMMDLDGIRRFAAKHEIWVVEDAAHAFPAGWRRGPESAWTLCGENTARVSCFSFYANKTITTGEGGMAVTDDSEVADRMRLMSLHGLSHDAWGRYSGGNQWDYRIIAPGFKYNLTDIAAGIGIVQLAKAEKMRCERESIAHQYLQQLADVDEIELPAVDADRIHSWHLFPIKLRLELLSLDRNTFMEELKAAGVACSVHWRPLHLHPYYTQAFGWSRHDFPVASAEWTRLVSLPIFPGMTDCEVSHVLNAVRNICVEHSKSVLTS
jgi:perosamine synthetase